MLSLYRRLIQLRKSTPALVEGSYRAFDSAPEDCLVFHRDTATQHIVVALNFTAEPREIDLKAGKILLSTIDRVLRNPLSLPDARPERGRHRDARAVTGEEHFSN